MEIKIANSEVKYKECFEFIKNMWKAEFEINFELTFSIKVYNAANSL